MDNITTIVLEKHVRDRIKGLGKKGQTYNEIIMELLEAWEKSQVIE